MTTRIDIFSCTQQAGASNTLLRKSITKIRRQYIDSDLDVNIGTCFTLNNKQPLSVRYNQAIEKSIRQGTKYLILAHDDITIDEHRFIEKLFEGFKDYDICGLAGTNVANVKHPALWHIMGGGFQGGNLFGRVHHYDSAQSRHSPSEFGPTPHRVLMLDGLFLALGVDKIKETGLRFDESNPAIAHHYDLDFCLQANQKRLKMGVIPIEVIHASPGLRSLKDPQWVKGNEWFLNKWTKNAD